MRGMKANVQRQRVVHAKLVIRQKKWPNARTARTGKSRQRAPFGRYPHRALQVPNVTRFSRAYQSKQPAPTITRSFIGIQDTGWYPPDTMGAAGANHLVSVVNGGFAIFNKVTGARTHLTTLRDFWSHLGTQKGQPAYFVYDPKILFDTYTGRFVVVSMGGTKSVAQPGSWVLLAVSKPNNPYSWVQYAIQSDATGPTWSDYPGIGLDANHIYVTANMFEGNTFRHVKAWVFSKPQLQNGSTVIRYFYFVKPPGSTFTTQPSQVYGVAPNVQYLIGVLNGQALKLNRISFVNGVPYWTSLASIRVRSFPYPSVAKASQKGTSVRIETNDTRLLNAVYRNGYLYTVHHVSSDDQDRTEVAWYQINPTAVRLTQQGRIRNSSFSFYYPSIAVNAFRDIAIGFTGSSPNQYASGYVTGRKSSDPLGTVRPIAVLKTGLGPYTLPRWGDFSATVVDTDGASFWTIQEYAENENKWGTWWGKVRL